MPLEEICLSEHRVPLNPLIDHHVPLKRQFAGYTYTLYYIFRYTLQCWKSIRLMVRPIHKHPPRDLVHHGLIFCKVWLRMTSWSPRFPWWISVLLPILVHILIDFCWQRSPFYVSNNRFFTGYWIRISDIFGPLIGELFIMGCFFFRGRSPMIFETTSVETPGEDSIRNILEEMHKKMWCP